MKHHETSRDDAMRLNWSPVQTYCVWGFDEGGAGLPRSRGISADSKGRVFACYGKSYKPCIPSPMFVVVCCDRGRIVPIPLRMRRPISAVISPDGDWLYVLTKEGSIWRMSACKTGKWGKPQIVLASATEEIEGDSEDSESDEKSVEYEATEYEDDDWDVMRDLSMQCTGDRLWFWNEEHQFMQVCLPSGKPRVVHEAPKDANIKWWVLGPYKMTYKMTTNYPIEKYPIEVDLVTGMSSPGTVPFDGSDVSPVTPVTCALGPGGAWFGIAQPDIIDYSNALVGMKDGDNDVKFLIGGATMDHKIIHDAFMRGEPSSVGNVRHAVVDSDGQLWVMDTRHFDTTDYTDDHFDYHVCSIALRCIRIQGLRP